MKQWDDLRSDDRVELGLLQIDIAGHSRLQASDKTLKEAKSLFRKLVEGIVKIRGGRLFNWAGDGGSFMFLTGGGEGFDSMVLSGQHVLFNLPFINQEISMSTGLEESILIRLSCDSGTCVYDQDSSKISGDFINRFCKHEREIGLNNSITITDRVWRQLDKHISEQFRPFKKSTPLECPLYNSGGKERQLQVLRTLKNIEHVQGRQVPAERSEYVEVVAFEGDTFIELANVAYQDVQIEGFDNVGSFNLLAIKNAKVCVCPHPDQDRDSEDLEDLSEEARDLFHVRLKDLDPRERDRISDIMRRFPRRTRVRLIKRFLRHKDLYRFKHDVESYYHDVERGGMEPTAEFEGGEVLRFFNCTALGYVPVIGEGTLLDNVMAGNVKISKVVGGVPEPVVKKRIFELVDGEYHETESDSEL